MAKAFQTTVLAAALLLPMATTSASAQDLRAEIEALKEGQQQIMKDVQAIKKILEDATKQKAPAAGPAVAGKVFSIGDHSIQGDESAKLTLVEFTDYQ